MSTPFLGEIKVVSFNFPPNGWAFCNGQLLAINQNQALFSILGTTYGGNGQTTFALPDLRGRMPLSASPQFPLGQVGGEALHTLTINELPAHVHVGTAQSTVGSPGTSPAGAVPGPGPVAIYGSTPGAAMAAGSVTSVGGSQPHENEAPYLVLQMIIALQGIFPSRN